MVVVVVAVAVVAGLSSLDSNVGDVIVVDVATLVGAAVGAAVGTAIGAAAIGAAVGAAVVAVTAIVACLACLTKVVLPLWNMVGFTGTLWQRQNKLSKSIFFHRNVRIEIKKMTQHSLLSITISSKFCFLISFWTSSRKTKFWLSIMT